MTTVTCEQCDTAYQMQSSQHKYQINKNPKRKFFCTQSCSTTYHNNARLERIGVEKYAQHLTPQYGNQYGRKYPGNLTWYLHRITTDSRDRVKAILTEDERQEFVEYMEDKWMEQKGRCALSGVPLKRRVGQHGVVDTDNSFLIASLDRIDGALPYQKDNIQWVSQALNLAKNDTSDGNFRMHLGAFIAERSTAIKFGLI